MKGWKELLERTKEEVRKKMAKLVPKINNDSSLKCPFLSWVKKPQSRKDESE